MKIPLRPLLCLVAAFACGAGPAQAKPTNQVRLDDTGVFECASPAWEWSLDCAGTGQDGETGFDATQPDAADGIAGFRFAKVCGSGLRAGEGDCPADPVLGRGRTQWACTLDLHTGALWELKTRDGGAHDMRRRYTHKNPGDSGYGEPGDAAALVALTNAQRLCGVKGWEVPNVHVLHSLMHYGPPQGGAPLIDNTYFPNTAWWVYAADPDAQVSFQLGWVSPRGFELGALRLVRTAVRPPEVRFVISADGHEVEDALTGLVWQRCVVGQQWDGSTCAGEPTEVNWYGALELGKAAGAPWRLPNIKEIASTLSLRKPKGPLDAFPGLARNWAFWSSTPKRQQPTHAWMLWNSRGQVAETYDWTAAKVRLVRDPAR